MIRSIAAVVLGCLYAAGSVWLVLSQGEAYRDALRRERLAAAGTEATSPRPLEEEVKAAPAASTPEPVLPRAESSTRPAVTTAPPRPARPANEGSPPDPAATGLAKAKPAPTPTADRPPSRTNNATGPTAQPPKAVPFWDQPALKETWDLAHLKTEDELRLGRVLHDVILQFNRPVETGPWQRRVEEAAEPFRKTRSRKDVDLTFTILDSDAVNAFSTPGGFIYVCRGLFNLIGEDEDYALEFVIGHEIAHVDLQHALRCLRDPGVMRMSEGPLQKLYMMIIPFAYLDSQEFEADMWVYRRMRQLGRTERESLAFLRKLDGHAKTYGFDNGRGKPQIGPDSSPVENHFRAHTAAWRRLDHLKAVKGKASSSAR
jgi:hypothetical protein